MNFFLLYFLFCVFCVTFASSASGNSVFRALNKLFRRRNRDQGRPQGALGDGVAFLQDDNNRVGFLG